MTYMRGAEPFRRTLRFLNRGKLILLDRVKILSLNFNTAGHRRDAHKGMQDFVFWDLHQVQYKNPNVQIVLFKNMTPSPFIRAWLDDGSEVLFDVDGQSGKQILNRLITTLGKTREQLHKETIAQEKKDSPANFGREYDKWCICNVQGQVPCPRIVSLPQSMRGKYIVKELLDNK